MFMYVHAPEMSSLSGEIISKQQSEQLIFFYTHCGTEGCAEHLLLLMLLLLHCSCGTNLCTASTSINCSALWIKTVILSINSLLRLPFDLDKQHIIHPPNVLPKSDLLCSPAPSKLNVAVSSERLMFAWSTKNVCAC